MTAGWSPSNRTERRRSGSSHWTNKMVMWWVSEKEEAIWRHTMTVASRPLILQSLHSEFTAAKFFTTSIIFACLHILHKFTGLA